MTRAEWKKHCHHEVKDKDLKYKVALVVGMVIVTPYLIAIGCMGIKSDFENYCEKKELQRQERYIEESHQKEYEELKGREALLNKIRLEEKNKQEETFRKQHENEIKQCARDYKIGDRIKIYDQNAEMVKIGDGYRWSIGGIDTIANIVDTTIYGDSGATYVYGGNFEKVRSNREWRELVAMEQKGKLTFVEG